MILSTILVLLTPVPGPVTSVIADPDHQHSWQIVLEGDSQAILIDDAFEAQYDADGQTYPVVLTRTYMDNEDLTVTLDAKIAVDCENSQTGLMDLWGNSSAAGEIRRTAEVVVFNFAKTPPSVEDQAILDYACGVGAAE